MVFQIRPSEDGKWGVWDENDEPRFTGPLRDCEDWLDLHENMSRRRGLRAWWNRLWGRNGKLPPDAS